MRIRMDIQKALKELDSLYHIDRSKVEERLLGLIGEAGAERDTESQITLYNEAIGFYRDRGRYRECRNCCEAAKEALIGLGMKGTVPYATTLLNIATALRAEGKLSEAMSLYEEVQEIYDRRLDSADYLYAALYNNISLLWTRMGDYGKAADFLERALNIVSAYPEARIEIAVTHVNLAEALLKTSDWEKAEPHIRSAMGIFLADEEKDFHYSMALSAMGEYLYRKGSYEEAEQMVLLAMDELKCRVGCTDSYEQLKENLKEIRRAMAARGSVSDPETERLLALSEELLDAGKSGQCDYEKALYSGDRMTAAICLSDFMKHVMRCAYLLNRVPVPEDRALRAGLGALPLLSGIEVPLQRIAELLEAPPHGVGIGRNPIFAAVETAAGMLAEELLRQGLTDSGDCFLPVQTVLLRKCQ